MSELYQGSSRAEQRLSIYHYGEIKDFFIDRGEPEFAGCVTDLESCMASVVHASHLDEGEDRTLRLPLTTPRTMPDSLYENMSERVKEEADGIRLYYKDAIPESTKDLLLLNELLVHGRVLDDSRDSEGHGRVLTIGNFDEATVYFVESYGMDKRGEYITWSVSNHVPKYYEQRFKFAQPFDHGSFMTTNQVESLRHDVLDDIARIPNSPVDEAELVRNYFRRAA